MSRPFVDITGQRFGRLTALFYAGQGTTRPDRLWLCKCDCGETTTARYHSLVSGDTTSCGCYSRENLLQNRSKGGWNKKPEGEACFNNLFLRAKNNAKSRKHSFELTKAEFRALTQSDCYYCGQAPSQIIRAKGTNGVYAYNGIDRIDSKRGYVIDNVRACCKTCNNAKSTLSEQEFFQWLDRIVAYRQAKR
jgi:hypothetical protein